MVATSAFVSAVAHPLRNATSLSSSSAVSAMPLRNTAFLPSSRVLAHAPRPAAAAPLHAGSVRMVAVAPETARLGIAVYGVLVAGGGIGAFLKSGSKPSIVSGVASGVVLAAAYFKNSVPAALATAAVLSIVFAVRLAKTKKFMPAGFLCILSLLAAVFFALSIYG